MIDCYIQDSTLSDHLAVLIYDNSPTDQQFDALNWRFGQFEYHHDATNGGLVSAYNHALVLAQNRGIEWLLLLDQDTVVGLALFSTFVRQIAMPVSADVCAMVPKLVQHRKVLSPQIVGRFRNHSVDPTFSGVSLQPVTALNSGSCLRVASVMGVGGFPKEYWLEYVDHVMFSRLQGQGGKVLILGVTMEHQLSLQNLDTEMSPVRYKKILVAEWQYVRDTGWGSGPFVHRLRLLKRALHHALKLRNKQYALQALHSVFSREKENRG